MRKIRFSALLAAALIILPLLFSACGEEGLSGGTKTLKKLFIDKKIPAADRDRIPVIADDHGVAAVHGLGIDRDHKEAPNWELLIAYV